MSSEEVLRAVLEKCGNGEYSPKSSRLMAALLGQFIGDAAGMPVHWYYNPGGIERDFGGPISTYLKPLHPHPDAFAYSMTFDAGDNKSLDILHHRAPFCANGKGDVKPPPEENVHYHHGLSAGDNTVNSMLVLRLIELVSEIPRPPESGSDTASGEVKRQHASIPSGLPTAIGGYSPVRFLREFESVMTEPASMVQKDLYLDVYIRRFFESRARGLPLTECTTDQYEVWSVGSMGGMLGATVVAVAHSLAGASDNDATEEAVKHAMLTHRSENVAEALRVYIPLLLQLASSETPPSAEQVTRMATAAVEKLKIPKISGLELLGYYNQYKGPGNIPKDLMYKGAPVLARWVLHSAADGVARRQLHTEAAEPGGGSDWKLTAEIVAKPVPEVIGRGGRFGTVCYCEQGLPGILYLLAKFADDVEGGVWAAANALGDTTSRAALLGALLGAARGLESFGPTLTHGLVQCPRVVETVQRLVHAVKQ